MNGEYDIISYQFPSVQSTFLDDYQQFMDSN